MQVGYQISTGRPRLKRNHRQEGIPPSWLRLIVSACQCQTGYRWLRNAIVGMRGYSASESGALQIARRTHLVSRANRKWKGWRARLGRIHVTHVCQNGAFRASSGRGPPLTFLSRIGCRGRLIASTSLKTLFSQIFIRRSLSRHSDLLRVPATTASSAAENETRSALEGTADPIGVPRGHQQHERAYEH